MASDKITFPDDPRISRRTANLNSHTYHYLYTTPPAETPSRGTIVLIHGFPDLSAGWRYQIPLLTSLGLDVIVPDCMGYGRTGSRDLSCFADYGFKRISDDIAELCRQLGISRIYLGGHDWGGAIVYRLAQYYPQLVVALFSVCTPYFPPNPRYETIEELVATSLPNFGYQIQLASGEVEKKIQTKEQMHQFLNGIYGGQGPNGEVAFSAEEGLQFHNLPKLGMTRLLTEAELRYYVDEYMRHGIQGPLNWYRNRYANYRDELEFFFQGNDKAGREGTVVVEQECLFILATRDAALKPFMAANMGKRIPKLTRKEVVAGHWALWQAAPEVNGLLKEWFEEKVFGKIEKDGSKL